MYLVETNNKATRTSCHDCGGTGYVRKDRAAVVAGRPGTAFVLSPCKRCKTTGWLPGFQAPV